MKRFICWFLCLSVLFSLLPVIPESPVIAQGEVPNLYYAGYIDWEGVNPAAGDDTFYMEYYGTGLSNLTAVICLATYNSYTQAYDYTPVASQVDQGIPLKDNDGKDRYLFKMSMDDEKVLEEGIPYYILMEDLEGQYYTPSINTYFTVEEQPYYPSVFGFQPVEIASDTQSVFLSLQAFGFAQGLTAQDFNVELVVAEKIDWGSGLEQEIPVPAGVLPIAGTMQDIVAYKIENGAYQLEGDVILNPLNFSTGQSLFARVTGKSAHSTDQQPNRTKYCMTPIFVIDNTKATPSQFNIINSLPVVTFDPEQGHGHHDANIYMKADSKHNFAIGAGDTVLYFELTGTGLSDTNKLSVTLNGAPVTLQQISNIDQGNGIKNVQGTMILPVSGEGTLSILYDGVLYHQTTLSRSRGANENGTTDFDFIDLYLDAPEIPAGGSFQIYLGYPMNLTLGANMFTVSMTDTNEKVISLQVTETLEQGLLTLTCVTPELLSGQYSLNVFYDQQPLQACSAFMGIVDFNAYSESMLIFKNTNKQTSLSYISRELGNIQINGISFESNVQYTARFIPRGTSSLNPAVISLPTVFQSDSLLVVEKALADTLPLGWYTVYLTIEDTLVNGFADTTIIPQKQFVMPTVSIEGDYTDKRDITLKVTFGSYQRVKIAESLADLSLSPWLTAIPETYLLNEGYGEKTLYFLFETPEGDQVTLSDSITYINATLDPVQFFGIAGATLTADMYLVNKSLAYSLYFTHTQGDLTGKVVFYSETDEILNEQPLLLYRTSGKNGIYHYSKSVMFKDDLENAKAASLVVENSLGASTYPLQLKLSVTEEATVTRNLSSFDISYLDNVQFITAGSVASFYMYGTPGYLPEVSLKYKTEQLPEVSVSCMVAENGTTPGSYKGSITIPEDAIKILSVQYKLTDPGTPENTNLVEESIHLPVTAMARFVELDNENGGYNNMFLMVISEDPNDTNHKTIIENATSITMDNLIPGIEYKYQLYSSTTVYATGSFNPLSGSPADISLSNALKPATLQFSFTNPKNPYTYIEYKYDNGEYMQTMYVYSDEVSTGFYMGQEITYQLHLDHTDLRRYKLPAEKTITLTDQTQIETIVLEPLPMITVTGKVTDMNITDRSIEGVQVQALQTITNHTEKFNHSVSTVTDAQGNYTLSLYADTQADTGFYKAGYEVSNVKITPALPSTNLDVGLSYMDKNRIRVNVTVKPLVDIDETQDLPDVQGYAHMLFLTGSTGLTKTARFYSYLNSIQIEDNTLSHANQTLSFTFSSDRYIVQPSYAVALDGNASGFMNISVMQHGVISVKTPDQEENAPVNYLLLFDKTGNKKGIISGNGILSTEELYLSEGDYTLLLVRGYNLYSIKNLNTLNQFHTLGLDSNYYAEKAVTVHNGVINRIDDMGIPDIISNDMLSAFQIRLSTQYTPNAQNGDVRVVLRMEPWESTIGKNAELNWIRIDNMWTYGIKDNSIYLDSTAITGSSAISFYGDEKKNLNHTLQYVILPKDTQQSVVAGITLNYTMNGVTFNDTIMEEVNVNRLILNVPDQVLQGDPAKSVTITGQAPEGTIVDIYDDDLKIATVESGDFNRFSVIVSLTQPDKPGVRFITGKMTFKEKEYISPEKAIEVLSRTASAYTSKVKFAHQLSSTLTTEFYFDDIAEGQYSSYNPNHMTTVSFRINNMLKSQVDSASVVISYKGTENVFPAEWIQDIQGEETYSEWSVTDIFGYIDDVYIQYSLKSLDDLSLFTGSTVPDFLEASSVHGDPAQIPSAFKNGTNIDVTESTPTSNKFSMNLEDGGTFNYNAAYTQNSGVTESMLDPRLYRKVTTQQGNYWVYENVEIFTKQDGKISCKVTRRIYFDSTLDSVINPPAKLMSVASMKTQGATDTTLSVIEHSGNLQNVGEVVYEGLKGAPAELGRFGSAMNAVGGVALAVNIFRGRTTKDAQTLYDALRLIENKSVRDALARDIRDYSSLTVRHYTISNIFNGVGYVSGYAGPLGKGLSVITSLGGGWYNDSTGSELNMMWDSIMRSILAELELQDIRAAKKEKKKKVTWLIDPSGYVFETIETNRVSGVEASILYSDAINGDFTFWSEAEQTGQVNPQITGSDGRFAWDVPSGFWKVAFDGTGYIPTESKPMEVDPLHDKVHIGLLSLKAPVLASAALNDNGFEIEFDLFMQGESIIEPVSKKTNIQLFDDNNNPIPIKDIEFIITAKNTTYKEGMTYQKDVLSTEDFVKRIRIVVDETNYPGGFKEFKEDGITPERYYVTVLENCKSYSGVKLAGNLTTDKFSVVSREKALAPSANVPQGSYINAQSISLSTQTEGATIYYTTDGSAPTPLSFVYNGTPVVIEKTGTLKCIASKVGMDDSDVASFQYIIGATIPTQVMPPVASSGSGTYSQSMQVVLTTATEGANIYFTLDGTEPTASKTLYTGPVTISNNATLKAVAIKTGLLNSRIMVYEYVIQASATTTAGTIPTGAGLNVERTGSDVLVQTGLISLRAGSKAMAHVPALMIQTLMNHANRSDINANLLGILVDTPEKMTGLTTHIPTDSIRSMANRTGTGFEINSDILGVRFDNKALNAIADQAASNTVTISVEEVPLSTQTDELKEKVGGNKVYQLTVKSGNKVISDFNGGFATVTIPYILKEGENPHAVVVWYLNDQGDMKSVRGSYVADLKAVVFTVNHFSYFLIKHDPVTFTDIPDHAWYKNAVDFIAARRITQGTGNNQYSPNATMTRGRFIVLLMNAYGITPERYPDLLNVSPFTDAGNTYYTKYLAVAKGLGIVQGVGNNQFAPEENITREEMFVMLYNILNAIGETPVITSTSRVNIFKDMNQVAPWAYDAILVLVNAEVINGDNGSIHPKRNTTAAETAQVLFNLLKQ